ncbi:MAG: TIGR02757 family protein [Myxococcota bacterium]
MYDRNLRKVLDLLYEKYNDKRYIFNDPIEFPHRYKKEEDILLIGFISAIFSYGKVQLFKNVLENLFSTLTDEPVRFLIGIDEKRIDLLTKDIYYRFYSSTDISILLKSLQKILKEDRLIEFFSAPFRKNDIITGITNLRRGFFNEISDINKNRFTDGINFMFPDPKANSPLKRIFMFLRWMVRKDNIDFGIINTVESKDLIIPLDTHTANIGRLLKMTSRRISDIKCAIEITNFLRNYSPLDPVKYDFALAHIGISEGCRHSFNKDVCKDCILLAFCNNK